MINNTCKHYNIPIFVPHIGCNNACIFCNQNKITQKCGVISENEVINTIESHLKTIPRENSFIEIAFFGGSFTGIDENIQNMLLSVAKSYKDRNKIDGIRLSTRPDYINEEILKRLKNYNVTTIELGVQSMDDMVLKLSKRGHTSRQVIAASKLIKKSGIRLGLQMMIGLYGDTQSKDIETAKKIIEQNPDFVRIYPTIVLLNTELYDLYKKGAYKPLSLDEATEICKNLLDLFEENNIKVIRVGLVQNEDISLDNNIIGPFHPCFKEIVESKRYFDKIIKEIGNNKISNLTIYAKKEKISQIIGHKKENIKKLSKILNAGVKVFEKNDIKNDFDIDFK